MIAKIIAPNRIVKEESTNPAKKEPIIKIENIKKEEP